MESLCHSCRHVRLVRSGKGSVFWLCELAHTDPRYAKYPPQPVVRCSGHQFDVASPPSPPPTPQE